MVDYSALDLTWTILRVSLRTPTERHGADGMRRLVAAWENVSRYGVSIATGQRAGTSALVPYEQARRWRAMLFQNGTAKRPRRRMTQLCLFADAWPRMTY